MANKRMFTMKIVDSDAFLDMSLSAQCLYFHLNMRADDDGFVDNPKRIMKVIGANDDDLRILIAKRFLLSFDNGVIVIKHWRMHNTLSKSRYHETQYLDEKSSLRLKENGAYSLTNGIPIDDKNVVDMFSGEQVENKRRTNGEQVENADIDIDIGIDKELDIDLDTDLDTDIDKDLGNTTYSCSEQSEIDTEQKPIIDIILNDKTLYPIYQEDINEWLELYPAVDVIQELRKMKDWSKSNPTKRKTRRGVRRFITNWLMNAQDEGTKRNSKRNGTIDWSKV
jgi:hypothetical protein